MRSASVILYILISTVGASLLGSCVHEAESFDVLVDPSERIRRRRARMNVQVVMQGQPTELTQVDFLPYMAQDCLVAAASLSGVGCQLPAHGVPELSTTCGEAVCVSAAAVCLANRYLEAGSAVGPLGSEETFLVLPPQSNATRAGFLERATYYLEVAINVAGEALRAPYVEAEHAEGSLPTTHCDAADLGLDLPPQGEGPKRRTDLILVGNLAEAHAMLHEAAQGAVRRNVAEGDNERSHTPDRAAALMGMWRDPILSRAHAARILYGTLTDIGVEDNEPLPYGLPESCALPQLTERGRRALDYVRVSGVSPSFVRTDQAIPDFLDAGGEELGVISRLQLLNPLIQLPNGDPVPAFLEAHGLSTHDFAEARAYLRCELAAIRRDETDHVTIEAGETSIDVYHAVRRAPQGSRGPEAWADVLEGEPHFQVVSGTDIPWEPHHAMRGAVHAADYVRRVAAQIASIEADGTPPAIVSEAATRVIGLIAAQAALTNERRIVPCASEGMGGAVDIRVEVYDDGRTPIADYDIVTALGWHCAVSGHEDGAECSVGDYLRGPAASASEAEPSSGYARRVTLTYTVANPPAVVRDFLVLRRPGLSGSHTGGYEILAPLVSPPITSLSTLSIGERFCGDHPAGNSFGDDVGGALGPSPDDSTRPARPCTDFLDLPIPLEAELTEDGDRYESSWRGQLAIARQAADLADQLAEEHIGRGLDVDSRAEAAQREIEQICGVSLDLSTLFDSSLASTVGAPCSDGTCSASGYECMGGVCVESIAARVNSASGSDSRSQRILTSCLGEPGSVVPVVALGSRDLCVWRHATDRSLLCDPDALTGGRAQCPFDLVGTSCTLPDGVMLSAAYQLHEVRDRLEIFETDRHRPSGGPTPNPNYDCGTTIRLLRDTSIAGADYVRELGELIASDTLSRDEALRAAERVGWRGRIGDFGTLVFSGLESYETGNPLHPTRGFGPGQRYGGAWPCVPFGPPPEVSPGECMGSDRSLFCSSWRCEERSERVEANHRVARAVAALGILSGFGLANLELPVGTRQEPPSEGPVGSSAREIFVYINDSNADGVGLVRSNYAGWHGSGDHEWGGHTYRRVSGASGPLHVWTGLARGQHINSSDCSFPPCNLNLIPGADGQSDRSYRFFTFARFGDRHLWSSSDEARTGWLSELWSGTDSRGGPVGAIRIALESGRHGSEARWAEHLGLSEAGRRGGLRTHTRLATHPLLNTHRDLTASGNYARLFDTGGSGGTYIPLGVDGMSNEAVLDALELLCYVNSPKRRGTDLCTEAPLPDLRSEADIPAARNYLRCLANDMEAAAEFAVAQNVPVLAVDAGRGTGASIAPLEGEFGRAVSGARETLLTLREQPRAMATQVRAFEADLDSLAIAIRQGAISRETIDWRLAQDAISTTATCAQIAENQGKAGYAACTGSLANLAISFRIADLQRESATLTVQDRIIDIRTRMNERVEALQRINTEVNRLTELLGSHMSAITASQRRARRALSDALLTASIPGQQHLGETPFMSPVNTAMRRRYATSTERYGRAFRRAQIASVLATRSIEQRLGMTLSSIPADVLPLLEGAPGDFAATLCMLEPLDYARIRDVGWTGEDGLTRESFADGFIGDYVRDLQAIMDSYPYAYPYTDGSDVAVVSLRDDVFRETASCPVASYNHLFATNELGDARFWPVTGCAIADPPSLCVGLRPLDTGDIAMGDMQAGPLADEPGATAPDSMVVRGYRFEIGSSSGSGGGVTGSTVFSQTVTLLPGTYRLSWYGRQLSGGPDPEELVTVAGYDGTVSDTFEVPTEAEHLATGWKRYFLFFDLVGGRDVEVRVVPGSSYDTEVDLGGFMVDRLASGEPASGITAMVMMGNPVRYQPPAYLSTNEDGMTVMSSCEDTLGTGFRAGWTTGCERLCSRGFGPGCSLDGSDPVYCYWEREFVVSQREIERGTLWRHAGFAYGNFNYRIERIGVNVVGHRDCSAAESPTTCYASGTIPFSITHSGPYRVTNHVGAQYEAPLFTGSIEHARALASERYLTNPISGADRGLMADYMRADLRGRPLDGRFRVRIWDVPGVRWPSIEDVQLLVEYRYWNRSSAPSPAGGE